MSSSVSQSSRSSRQRRSQGQRWPSRHQSSSARSSRQPSTPRAPSLPQNTGASHVINRSSAAPSIIGHGASVGSSTGTPRNQRHHNEAVPDSSDEELQEVIMAVNVRDRGSVGCAYFVASEERLYCMEDVKSGGPDVVDALKSFVEPTVIIVPFNLDDTILDLIDVRRADRGDSESGSNMSSLPYTLDFRVSGDFKYEAARDKLMNLRLERRDWPRSTFLVPGDTAGVDDPEDFGDNSAGRVDTLLSLGCAINIDSRLSVGCAGAVLNYLGRRRNAAASSGDTAARDFFRVSSVHTFSLGGFMFVNSDTLTSLQIVQPETHPSTQNQGFAGSGAKEGLSIYGMFHHFAKTPQGKSTLRQYFLRPLVDIQVITQRLDAVSTFIRPDNQPLMDRMIAHLKAVKNMRTVLRNVRKGNSSGIMPGRTSSLNRTVWSSIREFLYRALETKQTFDEMTGAHRLAIFARVTATFDGRAMSIIGNKIGNTIDFELSIQQHRTVIKAGVDFELDEIKRTYAGLEDLLSHVAGNIARTISPLYDAQLNVIFFPQIGFLILVRRIPDTTTGVYNGEDDAPWEKQFYTSDYVYYKDAQTRQLDAEFGDVYGNICDREIELIQQLGEQILQQEELLNNVSDVCGELDCLLALAQGAREYNLCRPQMTEANVLEIKQGRHLLQERTVPTFIKNDTCIIGGCGTSNDPDPMDENEMDDSESSMMVVTGPNYSGKSVYLKQVGLITYMAHIGSFVPAEVAVIGLTDKILTRIWTRESVSRAQSAFMIDLQQMSMALNLATRRSLIIVDEFGKGTDSHDGAGLAAGTLAHLQSLGSESPKVIVATHFHEIFHPTLLPPSPRISCYQMSILVAASCSPVERQRTSPSSTSSTMTSSTAQDITYLYHLVPGRTSSSYGTVCARMNGIPEQVVAHAEELIDAADRGENIVALCTRIGQHEQEELREAEAVARRFLAGDIPDTGNLPDDGDGTGLAGAKAWLGRVLDGLADAQ